ncbi:TorF family putative porin [Sphingomonas sp.]|jgi:uncharacterized protein (TIGR02001 family)|uniref:TorF family putative porin n=1 Tax=Sphingomonas sp. TaxID=28214 RepID=UPI0035C83561
MHTSRLYAAALFGAAAVASPFPAAVAQVTPHASIELSTDERRRGISWSDGDVAPAAAARLDLPAGFDIGARVTGLRASARHGGADAVVDATLGYSRYAGAIRLDGFVTGHLFAGGIERLDYLEVGGGASYSLGPAELGAEARYAPSQSAIGGDNLYLALRGRVGVPATPYSITGSVGRSSGGVDDPERAARLRPLGRYHDWSVGVQRITGPVTLGLEYTGTDISDDGPDPTRFADRRNAGDRITARVALGF